MKQRILTTAALCAVVIAAGAASAQDMQGDRPAFDTLDRDGNGGISLQELQDHGAARFAEADTDADGGLSAEEMIAAAEGRAAERAAQMIARFDENGDGLLQSEEMPRPPEDRAARMFGRIDADGDGQVTPAEFDAAKERMGEMRGKRGHGPRGRG